MKNHPIYKDLNTSFVSLADLLKCLRQQRFIGKVHFKSGAYEADVLFARNNKLKAIENVSNGNRSRTNKDILRNILLRSREPNGIINVYQVAESSEPLLKRLLPNLHKKIDLVKEEYSFARSHFSAYLPRIQTQKSFTGEVSNGIKVSNGRKSKDVLKVSNGLGKLKFPSKANSFAKVTDYNHDQDSQLDTTAKSESASKNAAPTDWEILLNLMGELFGTVDQNLAKANINFAWMFEKIRLEVGVNSRFLSPEAFGFKYENGKIEMKETVSSNVFVEDILEVLKGVLSNLRSNSKFKNVELIINQEIFALIYDRKQLYDRFAITSKLKEIAMN